jgi:hypothetical protein
MQDETIAIGVQEVGRLVKQPLNLANRTTH